MRIETSHASRIGDRANNEDSAACIRDGETAMIVVADGMGGHERGETASAAAVEAMLAAFASRADTPQHFLARAFDAAHDAVLATGAQMPIDERPRTTCVAAYVKGREFWIAHAGDSRAYLLRDGAVAIRTRDHSHVEALIAAGEISEAAAGRHPLRNLVDRCLGGEPEPVETEISGPHELKPADVLVLCSDGFWEGVDLGAAAARLRDAPDLREALERLTEEACAACAPHADNATVAALRAAY